MARIKLERIETSTWSIINIRLSTSIFGLPMSRDICFMIFVIVDYFCEIISFQSCPLFEKILNSTVLRIDMVLRYGIKVTQCYLYLLQEPAPVKTY